VHTISEYNASVGNSEAFRVRLFRQMSHRAVLQMVTELSEESAMPIFMVEVSGLRMSGTYDISAVGSYQCFGGIFCVHLQGRSEYASGCSYIM
jgi:hypothetical protein